MPTPQERAQKLVADYAEDPGPCVWSHVHPKKLARQLRERIEDPDGLDQGHSGWCGPSSICVSLAMDAPHVYAQMVIDLVRYGHATVHHGPLGGLKLHPPSDIRHCRFKKTGIAEADWVPL